MELDDNLFPQDPPKRTYAPPAPPRQSYAQPAPAPAPAPKPNYNEAPVQNVRRQDDDDEYEDYEKDGGSLLWVILGFFFPMFAVALYIAWRNDLPERALSIGRGAIIRGIVMIACMVLCLICGVFITIAAPTLIMNALA